MDVGTTQAVASPQPVVQAPAPVSVPPTTLYAGPPVVLPAAQLPPSSKLGVSKGLVYLPCGFLDDAGELHDRAELREMRGHEEDILMTSKVSSVEKITQIIGNCLTKLGTITDRAVLQAAAGKLTIADRVVIVLNLRCLSLKPEYEFEITCPRCSQSNPAKVALDDLDVWPPQDRRLREYTVNMPSGQSAVVKIMTAEDELRLDRLGREKDQVSLALLARIRSLNGKVPTLADVKDLGIRDRCHIRDQYERIEGGVDTDIEIRCPACRHEFKSTIDVGQPSFFFPRTSVKRERSPTG